VLAIAIISVLVYKQRGQYLASVARASNRAFSERAATNAWPEGTASGRHGRMKPRCRKSKLNAMLLLQVHNHLTFEVPEERW
jgi:DNA polymerase I-like protein with 3'-5' exonuclease and polymerase domains